MFGQTPKFPNFAPKPAQDEMPMQSQGARSQSLQMPMMMSRLARMRSYGFGGTKNTIPVSQPMALTMGSHGSTK